MVSIICCLIINWLFDEINNNNYQIYSFASQQQTRIAHDHTARGTIESDRRTARRNLLGPRLSRVRVVRHQTYAQSQEFLANVNVENDERSDGHEPDQQHAGLHVKREYHAQAYCWDTQHELVGVQWIWITGKLKTVIDCYWMLQQVGIFLGRFMQQLELRWLAVSVLAKRWWTIR